MVIRLGRAFAQIACNGTLVSAGSAALDINVAAQAGEAGIGGMEFLSGVPGTIGGALCMNAGAYGGEMKDITRQARALHPTGGLRVLDAAELGFGYRHSALPEGWILVDALLEGRPASRQAIAERMAEIRSKRESSQPLRSRTGGSTFANPPGHKAWQLIDQAGCRGLTLGGAQVSEMHCNFLINTGTATAADLEGLGEEVRRRVFETSGVELCWEIRRIGIGAKAEA